jgi:drug/metabolite transporter (DMT)-like permease
VLLGVAVLDEHFGLTTGIGFAFVLAGCFLATRPVTAGADIFPVPPVAEP